MRALLAAALALAPLPASAQVGADQRAQWNKPLAPFRIAGNVHYVGTAGLAAYLITDPAGHILIDGALEESASQIAANIRTLGFRIEDVRILLINHAHWDHSGGLSELKRRSGARLLASRADTPDLETGGTSYRDNVGPSIPVPVDAELRNSEEVRLGATRLVTHLTPGHTRGCTSWTMRVEEQGRPLDLLFACSLSVAGQPLVGDKRYPKAAADFRATFKRLRGIKADIYLSYHPGQFDLDGKRARLAAGDPLAFVDPAELSRRIDEAEAAFATELARQKAVAK